jgi:hypothetical protein
VEGLLGSLAGAAAERASDEIEETEKELNVIQIAIAEVRDLFLA